MKRFTSTAVQDGAWWAAQSEREPDARSQGSHPNPTLEDLREAISVATDLNGTEIDALLNLPPRPRLLRRFRRVGR